MALAFVLFNPRLTAFVESEAFRAGMEKETAKRLHFSSAHYKSIKHTGFLTVKTRGFDGGAVGIQVYEPKPESSPAKPWYHLFLPQRVYLKRVEGDPVDVTWARSRGEAEIRNRSTPKARRACG